MINKLPLQLLAMFLLASGIMNAQHACAKHKQNMYIPGSAAMGKSATSVQIAHEMKYDVKFVHLDLNLERTNKLISGNVKTVATVTSAVLDTFQTILHQNHTVDSIRLNGMLLPSIRQDSVIKAGLTVPLTSGNSFTVIVYYNGTAPNGGSAIGSGYNQSNQGWYNNAAAWSLSQPFVAYHWWPCKQVLPDKIDSSWVSVTTDSANKVGSNGILKNVTLNGSKKRYDWKSGYMIDYYLVSVAIAQYREYNQYAKPQYLVNDSIFIQNYIYKTAWNNSNWQQFDKPELDKLPLTLEFLSDMYGMYPFYKEKYGNCMGSFGGGMEHQTMTTQGFFDFYIDAHELGHQWWGDNVTCASWKDIWLNEGFASYTEHLVAEYLDPANFATNLNGVHNNVMGQAGGSCFFTGADTLNNNRIFSSRLTYDKGGAIIHSLRFVTNNDSLWFNTLRGFQNTYKNSTATVIDFKNYYQAQTGINPTQFFAQWFYGEGFPTFNIKYNLVNNVCWIKTTQTTSMPTVTPLFITPLEYLVKRNGYPDTTIRVMHSTAVETYSFAMSGTITAIFCDPRNWIINKTLGPTKDPLLGAENTTGLQLNGFSSVTISPNPTSGAFSVINSNSLAGTVSVYSLSGKFLMEKPLGVKTSFDLGGYPSGIYIVKISDQNGDERFVQKIIRQ